MKQHGQAPPPPGLLTIAEVAVHLGVCRQTVSPLMYREKLPSIKVRGVRRVHPDSLRRWLAEREALTYGRQKTRPLMKAACMTKSLVIGG